MTRVIALCAPLIWFANHAAQFALAPLACRWQSNAVLLIVGCVALVLDAGTGIVAWAAWQSVRTQTDIATRDMPPWLALSGIALSASFFIVIVAQLLPVLMLGGCA